MGYWKKRWAAFGYAFKGLLDLVRNHPHAHLHLIATTMTILAGLNLRFAPWEWMVAILCLGLVWAAEAMNTALEYLTDLVSPEYHPLAGKAKDMAAAGVLCAAIAAFVVGLLLVGPKLWRLVSS